MTVSIRRRTSVIIAALGLITAFAAGSAWGSNPFVDISGNSHAADIDAIYNAGITLGCATGPDHYCPSNAVTRDQMASFLARGLGLSDGTTKHFPVSNGRSQTQVYCALAAASPQSFHGGPCRASATAIDTTGQGAKGGTAIAIGSDGLPIIAYLDAVNADLKVVHCTNATCSSHDTPTALDTTNFTGDYSSIAIGADGLAVISYYDNTAFVLRLAHCDNVACTSATIQTPDSGGDVGQYSSIAIGADNLPIISYYDASNSNLKAVHCTNTTCTTNDTPAGIDFGGDVGRYPSIAIGTDSLPIISYYDNTKFDLKIAHCVDAACASHDLPTALDTAGNVGLFSSIAIGTDGLPIISYNAGANGGDLKMVHCTNTACTTHSPPAMVDMEGGGLNTSIAIGTDGVPIISYYDATSLKAARPAVT